MASQTLAIESSSLSIQVMAALIMAQSAHKGREKPTSHSEISRRTAKLLESRLDVDVIMTRDRDIFIPLRDRAALANRENADLFLSIHANAAPNNYAKGIETYSLASASDANAARVAARENAMAKGWSDKSDPVLGRLLAAGTDRLSREPGL